MPSPPVPLCPEVFLCLKMLPDVFLLLTEDNPQVYYVLPDNLSVSASQGLVYCLMPVPLVIYFVSHP